MPTCQGTKANFGIREEWLTIPQPDLPSLFLIIIICFTFLCGQIGKLHYSQNYQRFEDPSIGTMAPTKIQAQKHSLTKATEPTRRSIRTLAAGNPPQSQPSSVQCTFADCFAPTLHIHHLSEDPLQHYLPRPEYAAPQAGFANPNAGHLSQPRGGMQNSTAMRQPTPKHGRKVVKSKTPRTRVQTNAPKSKRAKTAPVKKKARAESKIAGHEYVTDETVGESMGIADDTTTSGAAPGIATVAEAYDYEEEEEEDPDDILDVQDQDDLNVSDAGTQDAKAGQLDYWKFVGSGVQGLDLSLQPLPLPEDLLPINSPIDPEPSLADDGLLSMLEIPSPASEGKGYHEYFDHDMHDQEAMIGHEQENDSFGENTLMVPAEHVGTSSRTAHVQLPRYYGTFPPFEEEADSGYGQHTPNPSPPAFEGRGFNEYVENHMFSGTGGDTLVEQESESSDFGDHTLVDQAQNDVHMP